MAKDIVPQLQEKIEKEFLEKARKSDVLKRKIKKLQEKNATHLDSNEFAVELGQMLSAVFGDQITKEALPDGKMYYNIAKRLIGDNLTHNYDLASEYAKNVQQELNMEAGISIKAIKPDIDTGRIDGLVEKMSGYDTFEEGKWLLHEPVVNFTQAIVDATIKKNAEFQYKAGLRPKIVRRVGSDACKWCKAVAGVYEYPNVPPDVYRKHENCNCTLDYMPGNGKKQDVWDRKRWVDVTREDEIEIRQESEFYEKLKSAKTVKEANKIAEDMGFQANYSGIDVKCANEWNEGLYKAKKEFPEIAENIKFVGSSQKRYSLAKKEVKEYYAGYLKDNYYESFRNKGFSEETINTCFNKEASKFANKIAKKIKTSGDEMASSFSYVFSEEQKQKPVFGEALKILEKYHGITMSNKYFNKYGNVIEKGLEQMELKWHPEGCFNVKSTFDHEFAHQIDKNLNISANETVQKLFDDRTKEEITRDLCRYAWDNDNEDRYSEMIAEGWSEYCNNDQPREMAKTIGKEIVKAWKKKR